MDGTTMVGAAATGIHTTAHTGLSAMAGAILGIGIPSIILDTTTIMVTTATMAGAEHMHGTAMARTVVSVTAT